MITNKDLINISTEDLMGALIKRGVSLSTAEQAKKDIEKTKSDIQRAKEIKLRDARNDLKKALIDYATILLDEERPIIAEVINEGFSVIEQEERKILEDKEKFTKKFTATVNKHSSLFEEINKQIEQTMRDTLEKTPAATKKPSSTEIIQDFLRNL